MSKKNYIQGIRSYPEFARLPLSGIAYPSAIIALQPTIGFDKLWYWVGKRHAIYTAQRERKPVPWTPDPILAASKFTDVVREPVRICKLAVIFGRGVNDREPQAFAIRQLEPFTQLHHWK